MDHGGIRTARRRPFVGIVFPVISGILIADYLPVPAVVWSGAFLVFLPLACLFRRTGIWVVCVMIGFSALHAWRHHEGAGARLAGWIGSLEPVMAQAGGIVVGDPVEVGASGATPRWRFPVRLETVSLDNGVGRSVTAKADVWWPGVPPRYGDRVWFNGTAARIAGPRNPAQFDSASHGRRQGLWVCFSVRHPLDCGVVSSGHGNPLVSVSLKTRDWMDRRLRLGIGDAPLESGLIAGVVLGREADTPEEVETRFRQTGTLHLFAVSGLHVAMFSLLLWMLLRLLPLSRNHLALLVIPLLLFYALLTGWRPSVLRAVVMTVFVLGGLLFDRRASLANNLAAAAFLLLAADTNQIFQAGFQLSFLVVVGILLFAWRFAKIFERLGAPDAFIPASIRLWHERLRVWLGRQFGGLASVSLAAWIGSVVPMVLLFNLITPIGLLANLVVVPLAFLVLILGVFSILAAPFGVWISVLFNNANWLVATVILKITAVMAPLPGACFHVPTRWVSSDVAALVVVFDVGDGGAVYLRADGEHWLIDTGGKRDYPAAVAPLLRRFGVNRLDGLILTHGDAAHIGGAIDAWEEFRPRRTLHSALGDRSSHRRAFAAFLSDHKAGREILVPGEVVRVGRGVAIGALYPPPGIEKRLADDKAMVLTITASGRRILLESDAGASTEHWLAESLPATRADVVVKGWHARDFSGGLQWLVSLKPDLVVSAREDPREPPRREEDWDRRLQSAGISVWPQESTGAVEVRVLKNGDYSATPFLLREIFEKRAR